MRFTVLSLAFAAALSSGELALAVHIPTSVDVAGYRNKLVNEGYLNHTVNPAVGRFGEEWTGWVDIRHPSLAGATDTNFGYDRSDRRYDVRSNILTDANGQTAAPNRIEDFHYANKAFMLQAGVSVIETSTRAIASGAGGANPAFTFPLSHGLGADQAGQPPEEQSLMTAYTGGAPTIETYYAGNQRGGGNSLFSGAFGETYNPSLNAGGNNEGIFMAQTPTPRPDTFAHELYHFVGDGQAVHAPNAGDPAHSTDPSNLIASGGIREIPTNISQVGPVMSATVGGVDQLTSSQVDRMFNNAGAAPWLQKSDNDAAAGDRVDWDFVADHNQWANDHDANANTAKVNFGLEGITGADNHPGVESLYWGIGATQASSQVGKDKTGLGVFDPTPDFAGRSFRTVDVFSLGLRYSDSDVNAAGGLSLRESALDYDLFFVLQGGGVAHGQAVTVFIGGWTPNSFADNYLARWYAPAEAVGVFIFALNTDGHDGVTQIDAVIAGYLIPEPLAATLGLVALSSLLCRRISPRRA